MNSFNMQTIDLSNIFSEADVEEKIILPLFKELGLIRGISDYRLRVPIPMTLGRQKITKEADIIIYKDKKPFVVIEAKKKTEKLDDDVISQLDSYAIWSCAKYGVACNGREFVIRGYLQGNERVYLVKKSLSKLDIDLIKDAFGAKDNQDGDISVRLVADQSESFSTLLKDIHQDIRNIDKLDPTNAFDGWSKLLFMKINEEKWAAAHSGKQRLSYKKFIEEKEAENAANYINQRFKETCNAYPRIFGENSNEEIGLSLNVIEKILERLDGYHINEIPMDVKGKAFEIFLSSTFRGKGLGQFFTPRQVVDFMISIVNININTTLLDPACGTGGFLIKGFQRIKKIVTETPDEVFTSWGTSKQKFIDEHLKESQIFGIDAEPRATKTSKMNMIMWGDGENVVRGNGLDTKDITNTEYPFNDKKVSLILANPPFGNKEKETQILKKYDLYNKYNIEKTECLFIERAINILEPDGELAIVIPDGVLACEPTKCVRQLIRKYAKINAVISLPKHTFTPSGVQTISTSVLYIKKHSKEYLAELENLDNDLELELLQKKYGYDNYNIFMGVAQEVGYEPNGKASRSGRNDLDVIYSEYIQCKQNNFYNNQDIKRLDNNCLVINLSQIKSDERIDARYYWFNILFEKLDFEKVELNKYIEIQTEKIKPKESAPEETFSIVSVTKTHGIILDESDEKKYEVKGADISKAKIVHSGDIAFNPYRINVGSIGIVGEEYDSMLISDAYVVFRVKNGLNPKVLCALLKNELYNLYIDIYGLGSIRTSLSASKLKKIKIPKQLITGNVQSIMDKYDKIDSLKAEIQTIESDMQKDITSILGTHDSFEICD